MKAVVFDDEKTILNVIRKILKKENIEVYTFERGKNAVNLIKELKPDIVFLDINLKDANGIDILKEISRFEEKPFVVMISGYNDYKYLIEAMKLGAYDYIPKPFDIDKIKKIVKEIKETIKIPTNEINVSTEIVGKSPLMANVFKLVGRASTTDEPVLITGESGTGKEVIANLIHKFSPRSENPFIAINCAAIPGDLIESELFGFEKGAFTGAITSKKGKFELADKGTLFLDEISQLTYDAQGKLLRAIQEKEIIPIGSNKSIKIDVKIIAATNENLKALVEKGLFREDLFYRLSVFEINLPPLRERKEDIIELINLFTKQTLKKLGLKKGGFSEESIEILQNYDFPGNVRELKNLVSKLISIYRERIITPDLLPPEVRNEPAFDIYQMFRKEIQTKLLNNEKDIYYNIINGFEKILIEEALKVSKGNISKAANLLGIHRNTLHKKIKELNLK
ncbi:sigma-54 dependent transcriptional regulator [Hydrogenivirga sp. 128-5-R1-1]|uniref:sigma-54-dependent transcriptional regulator n=1 Tax=Hydrogenivirga sp. 128-5-R1-1 TaxID=392423 RepID=UPI00015F3A6D|nr:sigma-54 dependent transcriptional regulator [Hydrogenivirga sp. 128-5-R1-1]EDP73946.1 nitrogen regulation protein NR(I) [Hydrogenivirga sp. 128-5-R1-1]